MLCVCVPSFTHRLRLPQFPWPFVSPVFSGVHHFLSFLWIEVRHASTQRHSLRLNSGINLEVYAASHRMRDAWADDHHAVSPHENTIVIGQRLRQGAALGGITDQHIRHSEGLPDI